MQILSNKLFGGINLSKMTRWKRPTQEVTWLCDAGPDTRSMQIFSISKTMFFRQTRFLSICKGIWQRNAGSNWPTACNRRRSAFRSGTKAELSSIPRNKYLDTNYPSLSYIKTAKVLYDHEYEKGKTLREKSEIHQRAIPKDSGWWNAWRMKTIRSVKNFRQWGWRD